MAGATQPTSNSNPYSEGLALGEVLLLFIMCYRASSVLPAGVWEPWLGKPHWMLTAKLSEDAIFEGHMGTKTQAASFSRVLA